MTMCAFAGCSEAVGDVDEILQDGAVFRCCSGHHKAIALVTAESVNEAACAQLKRASVRMYGVGDVDHVSGAPGPDMVYFMRRASGHIKIGFSRDVEQRCRQLQGKFGPLDILHTELGGFTRERQLHVQFADDRFEGEWFEPSAGLLDYLEQVTGHSSEESVFDDDEPITLD